MRRDPLWALVLNPVALLPIQLPAAWESRQGWPKALGPSTRVGDLKDVPGSWLGMGAALAVMDTWGVNHRTEDLLCLSSSL